MLLIEEESLCFAKLALASDTLFYNKALEPLETWTVFTFAKKVAIVFPDVSAVEVVNS